MAYSYTPTYYTSLHDSIASLCKTIAPFSLKKRRLLAAERKLSDQQSDNLKWQQESFHQILNLMGLRREGIIPETEVSAFRIRLLDSLIASPINLEPPVVLRDKLLFLQELLYAKCISTDEYHSSKRPLLQRLAVQGVEIEARDIILAAPKAATDRYSPEEEWSEIDLGDEQEFLAQKENPKRKKKPNMGSAAMKQINRGATSVLTFVSSHKHGSPRKIRDRDPEMDSYQENPLWNRQLRDKEGEMSSILMPESVVAEDKVRRKPFGALFQREQGKGIYASSGLNDDESTQRSNKISKKQWRFDGIKNWKRKFMEVDDLREEEEASPEDVADGIGSFSRRLVESPFGEGPDTKLIKQKLHPDGSASDFFIDKVLGNKIKRELSRLQSELCSTNSNLQLSDDQIEAISTKLPVDKADLKNLFPKPLCDKYGDVVLDVVRKEFKDHVGEMESMRNAARLKGGTSARRAVFDGENRDPKSSLVSNEARAAALKMSAKQQRQQ